MRKIAPLSCENAAIEGLLRIQITTDVLSLTQLCGPPTVFWMLAMCLAALWVNGRWLVVMFLLDRCVIFTISFAKTIFSYFILET